MKVKVSTLRRIIREEYTRIIREATLSRPDEGAPDSEWEKYFRSKCEVDAASMPERMRKSTIDSCVTSKMATATERGQTATGLAQAEKAEKERLAKAKKAAGTAAAADKPTKD